MWLDVAEVWLQLVREDKVRCLLVDIPKEELTHFFYLGAGGIPL